MKWHASYQVKLQHSLMLLHIYGAFFGIMTSWTLGKGIEPRHEKEKSDRKMALFSLFGECKKRQVI